jgi:hypothetical protein
MINVIVAYDDIDRELGDFFRSCYYDLLQYFGNSKNNIQWIDIDGDNLSRSKIQEAVSSFEGQPFVCLAYSHGTEDALQCDEGIYIDRNNCYFFCNSFFYTFSCKAGKELGDLFVAHGCKNFVGYKDTASVILTAISYFVECANHGIKCFFENQNSLDTYHSMLDKYEEVVDRLREKGDMDSELISTLTSNKNALIMLPENNNSVSIEEFVVAL